MLIRPTAVGFILLCLVPLTRAIEPKAAGKRSLEVEDLYLFDTPQAVTLAPDESYAVYVRQWIDPQTKEERMSLWRNDPGGKLQPMEKGEPDARSPVFSPDGRWIAIRSTRPRPEGWPPTPTVPLESDPATDIWLLPAGGLGVPLAGRDKPYGRVFNDPFYGRVAFSPDGKRLAFVADDGRDPRSSEEQAADVYLVEPDQGEGYTGYGPAQIWIAELADKPDLYAAQRIVRRTDDFYGFSYTRRCAPVEWPTFVVAGAGELPEGVLAAESIVRLGDQSPEGIVAKAMFVVDLMVNRLWGLGADWSQVSAIDIYTVHPVERLLPEVILARAGPAAVHGIRWFYSRPPIEQVEYEMDLRGVRSEVWIG